MPGKESSVFGDDGGGDTWMQRPAGEVDMTTYTPLPEDEQLPDMSELEREVPDQSAGMTPLDQEILEEELHLKTLREQQQGDQV